MASWRPDWKAMMQRAPELALELPINADADADTGAGAGGKYVYLVADSHLGDERALPEEFLAMLEGLPEAGLIVLLGDLFKVWLALPKFWEQSARELMAGLARIRKRGTRLWFVVGNREFFLPRQAGAARRMGIPFDEIVHEAAILQWEGRRYGMTHGDLANREDSQYLKWRKFSRGFLLEGLFRAMPGPVARGVAARLERMLASTNQEIKIQYPETELQAFAATVLEGLDGYFIGHFHREDVLTPSPGGPSLRIVPDWFSRRKVLRLRPDGVVETLEFPRKS